jgi:ABC-type multidrug transport system fused ATPase/permease subunit
MNDRSPRPTTYLWRLVTFAARRFPWIWFACAASIASVFVELAAMSTLLPLSALAAGGRAPEGGAVVRALGWLGVRPDWRALALTFVALFSLRVITQALVEVLSILLSKRLQNLLSCEIHRATVSTLSLGSVQDRSIGHFVTLAGDETARAANVVLLLIRLVGVVCLAAVYWLAVVVYSRPIGLATLAFVVCSAVMSLRIIAKITQLGGLQTEQMQLAHNVFLDSLNGVRSVRAFSADAYVTARYRDALGAYLRTLLSVDVLSLAARVAPGMVLLLGAALLLILFRPAAGGFDVATAFTVTIFLLRFFPTVSAAALLLYKVFAEARSAEDVTDAATPASDPRPVGAPLAGPVDTIALRDVDFGYGTGGLVLSHLSLRFERGTSYALIGKSGAGKSTIADLLLRFREPRAGCILIGSQQSDTIEEAQLRRRIVLLEQESFILNDTVRNNIAFGMSATDAEITAAAKLALLEDVIARLPGGLDATLRYRGTNLSGGERQRIGLARAFLRHPEVLILDESTSALDETRRAAIVDNVLREMRNGIVIFITHDAQVRSRVDEVIEVRGAGPLLQSAAGE